MNKRLKLNVTCSNCGNRADIWFCTSEANRLIEDGFYPRETFARWYGCGARINIDDGYEVRPNLIFQNGKQKEKVRYDDWNGVAAYGDTFNKNFGEAQE